MKKDKVKVAYIIGPYRAATINETRENIRTAESAAAKLWEMGYAVICPHTNSAFMDGAIDDEFILDAYIEILRRCDIAVLLPGWGGSKGSRAEYVLCEAEEKEVYFFDLEAVVLRKV